MDFTEPDDFAVIRAEVRRLCDRYGTEYWRNLEPDRYPDEFVADLTTHGWLAALIPEQYGGGGLNLAGASVILEEIAASGGNPAVCHAQMYVMGTLLRHGSERQKQEYLPAIAEGRLRLQAFGVTEPDAGSETTAITTRAVRDGDVYRVTGQKVWTSRALHSDLMILLARTTPVANTDDRTSGLSTFLIELRDPTGELRPGVRIEPLATWMNHHTTEVFFDEMEIPATALIGVEGRGFRQILDGMNAERILIAAECIGDGTFLLERASAYATQRRVFGHPIGRNQGVQFPLAKAYTQLRAADLMRWKAAWLFDQHEPCAAEANMAKLLASEASWAAANASLDTHGGYGFAVDFDIERKVRETRLYQIAPINNNLVLAFVAERCLGLPRSY